MSIKQPKLNAPKTLECLSWTLLKRAFTAREAKLKIFFFKKILILKENFIFNIKTCLPCWSFQELLKTTNKTNFLTLIFSWYWAYFCPKPSMSSHTYQDLTLLLYLFSWLVHFPENSQVSFFLTRWRSIIKNESCSLYDFRDWCQFAGWIYFLKTEDWFISSQFEKNIFIFYVKMFNICTVLKGPTPSSYLVAILAGFQI